MLRFLMSSDWHLNDKDLNVCEGLMEAHYDTLKREGCQTLIIVGDLWDERHVPSIIVLNMIHDKFLKWAKEGYTIYWIRGNHEIPVKSDPERSFIRLFESLHERLHIINKPCFVALGNDVAAWMVPWFPAEQIHKYFADCARQSQNCHWARIKLLFSHIGLQGTQTAPSNKYTLNTSTNIDHLYSQYYNLVVLGDIHVSQWLNANSFYCGCPIQLTFGDKPNQGVWVYDATLGNGTLNNVQLVGQENFPQYKTYEIVEEYQLHTILEKQNNYVKIRCPTNLIGPANALYKGRRRYSIEKIQHKNMSPVTGRMEGVGENETEKILDIMLESNNLHIYPEYKELALWYLMGKGLT